MRNTSLSLRASAMQDADLQYRICTAPSSPAGLETPPKLWLVFVLHFRRRVSSFLNPLLMEWGDAFTKSGPRRLKPERYDTFFPGGLSHVTGQKPLSPPRSPPRRAPSSRTPVSTSSRSPFAGACARTFVYLPCRSTQRTPKAASARAVIPSSSSLQSRRASPQHRRRWSCAVTAVSLSGCLRCPARTISSPLIQPAADRTAITPLRR